MTSSGTEDPAGRNQPVAGVPVCPRGQNKDMDYFVGGQPQDVPTNRGVKTTICFISILKMGAGTSESTQSATEILITCWRLLREQVKRLDLHWTRSVRRDIPSTIWYYIEEASNRVETYGERAAQWMIPKKSLVDAGIPSAFEIDRPLATTSLTVFWTLARVMDRKRPQDGKVYAPNQRIGRELALKMATNWGAFYLKKEDQLGTLEPGKWADFIVLDRDYLTIPEDDIENIRVLMTMVGGRTVHLVPSLAGEIGMPSAGAQVTLGSAAAQW
jgi:hypothetical protein